MSERTTAAIRGARSRRDAAPSLALVLEAATGREQDVAPLLDEVVAFLEERGAGLEAGTPAGARLELARLERARSAEPGLVPEAELLGPALVELALEPGWDGAAVRALVGSLAARGGVDAAQGGLAVFRAAAAAPILTEIPPTLAVEGTLRVLAAVAPVSAAALWRGDGRLRCEARVPADPPSRRERDLAGSILRGEASASSGRALISGVPVLRWNETIAALVVRAPPDAPGVNLFLAAAANVLSRTLGRHDLLERNAVRERALVESTERRLVRLGFDLHDGPIQEVIALAVDVRFLRRQTAEVVKSRAQKPLIGRFDDLEARLAEIESGLRQLSHALEPPSAVRGDIETGIRRELSGFERRHGVRAGCEIEGRIGELTDSQRIVLYRLTQEALSNVREHAQADNVDLRLFASRDEIVLSVADDGRGFDVDKELVRCGREGRLGLIGMSERVRLLGGRFTIESREGGPTVVTATLPRWRPSL